LPSRVIAPCLVADSGSRDLCRGPTCALVQAWGVAYDSVIRRPGSISRPNRQFPPRQKPAKHVEHGKPDEARPCRSSGTGLSRRVCVGFTPNCPGRGMRRGAVVMVGDSLSSRDTHGYSGRLRTFACATHQGGRRDDLTTPVGLRVSRYGPTPHDVGA